MKEDIISFNEKEDLSWGISLMPGGEDPDDDDEEADA
tara:strand:- start:559 stop:669 length:111 start_codon:yes stop_codon:yes gene_type:complete